MYQKDFIDNHGQVQSAEGTGWSGSKPRSKLVRYLDEWTDILYLNNRRRDSNFKQDSHAQASYPSDLLVLPCR